MTSPLPLILAGNVYKNATKKTFVVAKAYLCNTIDIVLHRIRSESALSTWTRYSRPVRIGDISPHTMGPNSTPIYTFFSVQSAIALPSHPPPLSLLHLPPTHHRLLSPSHMCAPAGCCPSCTTSPDISKALYTASVSASKPICVISGVHVHPNIVCP